MIITCEECGVKFNLDNSLVKESGTKVRCSKCKHIFTAYPDNKEDLEELSLDTDDGINKGEDDLDLDLGLEGEDAPVSESAEDDGEGLVEDDLDLELELEEDNAPVSASKDDGEGLVEDDLDLELELEEDDALVSASKDDGDGLVEDDLDLDLDFGLEEGDAPVSASKEDSEGLVEDDLDLELELEEDDAPVSASAEDSDDLDLEEDDGDGIDLEFGPDTIDQEEINIEELEQTISETDAFGEESDVPDAELILGSDDDGDDDDEISIDEGIDEGELESMLNADDSSESTKTGQITDAVGDADKDSVDGRSKGKSKKGVMILLTFLIISGSLIVTHQFFFDFSTLNIPYISEFLKKGSERTEGGIKVLQADTNGEYIENSNAGKLFVVKGMLENRSEVSRYLVEVRGKLIANKKTVIVSQPFLSGNILDDTEIKTLDLSIINNRLLNTVEDDKTNLTVAPGKTIPFMIVFSDFPENIDEYIIEVLTSKLK